MRVLVTGDKGFIAKNLPKSFEKLGSEVIHAEDNDTDIRKKTELCVHRNSSDEWRSVIERTNVDIIIHNAAVVGTDVVALNVQEATLTNVMGTYNLSRACNDANIPICYLGTSVIYDAHNYQNEKITEQSKIRPNTYYGCLKLSGENIVRAETNNWIIIRPLFSYGGVGDMNSLMAKTFYAHKNGIDKIPMFLDPNKTKDYLHVEDFCDAVAIACTNNLLGTDFNIAAENPETVGEVVSIMSDVCGKNLFDIIEWYPNTDYLGNHTMSSEKFKYCTNWKPKISLKEGIRMSWDSIKNTTSKSYNPLKYIQDAELKNVDLSKFF